MSQLTQREAVYILIPVHNRKDTTLACLERLNQSGDLQRYYVTVIDDGSTDGTASEIRKLYPETIILPGDGDLWWTGAMAKGMQYAYEQGAEYFIWLNDDCVPVGDALSRLVAFMRSHPNTIAAPTCYAEVTSGQLVKQHNAFSGRRGFAANLGEILPAEGLSGWCVGIPASVFGKIGAPDAQRFPHYSGDDTYIYRATRAQFKAVVIGDIEVRLFGDIHPKLDFRNHFGSGATPVSTFQSLFLSKKSPYLLKTRFFYFTERYGFWLGIMLFSIKLILWLWRWINLQIHFWINSQASIKSVS